jgi:hypothetical protein
MGDRYAEERAVRIGRLVKTGRLTRLARRLWMGRSPLRRRTDRIEAWIAALLIALFLVGAPVSWMAAGSWVQHGGWLEQRAQQSWHRVPAVLLEAAPTLPNFDLRTSWNFQVMALARWSGPGGRSQAGDVPATPGASAGTTVPVWVNGSGRPTGTPLLHGELLKREIGAEVLAPLCLAVLLLCVGVVVRWLMNRRRLAGWETGWAFIGPRWSRHRR